MDQQLLKKIKISGYYEAVKLMGVGSCKKNFDKPIILVIVFHN